MHRKFRLLAGLSSIVMLMHSPGFAQDVLSSRVMTKQEIADQLALDEFRVSEMQQLVATANSDTISTLLRNHMNDNTKTVINYDTREVFIQYSSPDGKTYTWHPNDTQVTTGTWKLDTDKNGAQVVCFQAANATSPTCIPAPYILAEYCTLKMVKSDKMVGFPMRSFCRTFPSNI